MAEAKISVRSDLLKVAEDLKMIAQTANDTSDSLANAAKETGKSVNDQLAILSGAFKKMRSFGSDLRKQLGSDFKSLLSVNAMASGMKLSSQFGDSVKQAVNLNDTIRNLAPIFGMNEAAAEKFKRTLVKGLSDIGLGSDAAANALQGLGQTNVRGDANLSAYARTAGELASISKQKGQEGDIAKGMAGVVVAQGGNPNDTRAMSKVADDVIRIRNATGKTATEALETLNKIFSSANTDFKKRLSQGGGVSLAAAGLIGGQGSTAFLERYMGLSSQGRAGYEAQGLGRLIGKGGNLNGSAFQDTVAEAKKRGSGNAEFGLTTMGMSDEEAKGFLRLANAIKENGDAVENARKSQVDINAEYQKTMGLGDSFRANLNKVKGGFSDLMDKMGAPDLLNKATDALQGASQSTGGAAAVVGGSALLAAVLTGGALKGIGGAMFGDEAKKQAIEGITGEKVQRVEVINWPMTMGGANGAWSPWEAAKTAGAPAAAGAGGMAALPMAGAALAGLAAGKAAQYIGEGGAEDDIKSLLGKISDLLSGKRPDQGPIPLPATSDVRVMVETKDKSLKAYKRGSRGASQ